MNEKETIKINLLVEEKIFENKENSFAILQCTTNENIALVATGQLASVDEGELLKVSGYYVQNKNYGKQLKVIKFKRSMPTTQRGIIKFLSSGNIKGIGPTIAQKIVTHFKNDTINILENEPQKLTEIKGVGQSFVDKIKNNIEQFLYVKKLNIFLQQFNITPNIVDIIWNKWGLFSLNKINKNPYCLCSKDINLPFNVVDSIAKNLEISDYNENRIESAIKYVLQHNAINNGHSCIPKQSLIKVTSSFLKLEEETISKQLNIMLENSSLFSFNLNKEYIFLPIYYLAETFIAKKLLELNNFKDNLDDETFKNLIMLEEERLNIKFASVQKEAIKKAICSGVFILTGGPGTGKTTILNAVASILEQKGCNIAICAPTGKAAKRLALITNKKTTTIHRLLGVQQISEKKQEFIHNERNTLKEDVIIVDEMSMVDCMLFLNLLKATKKRIKLIISGDYNQLPCIAAGNVLKNLIESKKLNCVTLKDIFRQAQKSLIVKNAHNIINEKELILNQNDKDFIFIENNNPQQIEKIIVNLAQNRLTKIFGYCPIKDIQVICPCKKGIVGTININKKLQEKLNPKNFNKKEFNFGFYTYREGDKVLQIKNNYDVEWEKDGHKSSGIFNGEIGTITKINYIKKEFVIDFEGKITTMPFDMAKDIEPAWAITVHKSQGSEFKCVLIPIFFKNSEFFSRNLLYTAITRAKEFVIIVGCKYNILNMCKQKRVNFRYSCLKYFMLEN